MAQGTIYISFGAIVRDVDRAGAEESVSWKCLYVYVQAGNPGFRFISLYSAV